MLAVLLKASCCLRSDILTDFQNYGFKTYFFLWLRSMEPLCLSGSEIRELDQTPRVPPFPAGNSVVMPYVIGDPYQDNWETRSFLWFSDQPGSNK